MADINALFPSKYLRSADYEKGEETTYVISRVEVEKVGEKDGREERKPVLFFQNEEKGMVLNRTNADTIADLYGNDTEGWAGRPITVFVMRVSGPNGMTDGIRLKAPPKPRSQRAAPTQHGPMDDEPPPAEPR